MRTGLLIAGVVILVVGIALVIGGALGALGETTIVTSFTQPQTGEYVSTEFAVNSTNVVVVTSAATTGGLIPAQDLSSVSSTNVGSDAVTPKNTAGGTETYRNLSPGDYYYVVFSSSQPSSRLVITGGHLARTALYGVLVLAGIVLFVAGIVVAILGAVLKKSKSSQVPSYPDLPPGYGNPPAPPPSPSP